MNLYIEKYAQGIDNAIKKYKKELNETLTPKEKVLLKERMAEIKEEYNRRLAIPRIGKKQKDKDLFMTFKDWVEQGYPYKNLSLVDLIIYFPELSNEDAIYYKKRLTMLSKGEINNIFDEPVVPTEKFCVSCKETKEAKYFATSKRHTDQLQVYCRSCFKDKYGKKSK